MTQEIKWWNELLNNLQLVIPMAGLGSRFSGAGYTTPKPLLKIHGQEMFRIVIANLMETSISKVILIANSEWGLSSNSQELSELLGVPLLIVETASLTDGPAGSVELARPFLDLSSPVVVANSDQYIAADIEKFYNDAMSQNVAGSILCMEDLDPKWSFVKTDSLNRVVEVREKRAISNIATIGVYYFRSAQIMYSAFDRMRESDDKTNGEFYVAPAYNYIIKESVGEVSVHNLGPVGHVMFGMGIPTDFEIFCESETSRFAADRASKIFGVNKKL